MHRLWLTFAQAVTVAVAIVFVLMTFKPEWLAPAPTTVIAVQGEAPAGTPSAVPASPGSYASAARKALPSVVHIFTSKEMQTPRSPFLDDPIFRHFFGDRLGPRPEQRTSGLGSGVIASSDGYILTNNHVIEAADAIEVALNDGRKFEAKLVGRDPETDLAVLRIEAGVDLPAVTFAPTESLTVGDVVLAIGNPFGVGQTVTMGIVSALQRSHLGISTFENFIQTDAAINPGNSGGALVNSEGALVGINAAIYSRSGGSLGIGFAIPVTFAKDVMDQIIRTGRVTRGWIGVEIQDITQELAESFGLPDTKGALIAGVMRGGPADKGGIQPGDVLVAIEAQAIPDPQRMLELVAALPPGASARFLVRRKGRELELPVKIGRRPTLPRPQ
ncbi:Do family serine endopeptidase [Denitromonas iodatirespirans]|uniref:Do family serine endopeptidase n=1 Tax=Denitromonas iodatirespirans TaxID=2795389 RepID=A0A944H8W9_DENI1|nr:Do family serine endopeptidase [Denitromonas iodatirespirans]MBT0962649.1 Do family serine endopeptidase [Denitromonas iodatirespirans]